MSIGKCIKVGLPNGKVVDVLSTVLDDMLKWIQDEKEKPESGGYIVGYQHEGTGNISLEAISVPSSKDASNRIFFAIRDPIHNVFLNRARRNKSYYMGVWHTHPQEDPAPSIIDWNDWKSTMKLDKSGSQYIFFIIIGTVFWRMWIGDMLTGEITEGREIPKGNDGIYKTKDIIE